MCSRIEDKSSTSGGRNALNLQSITYTRKLASNLENKLKRVVAKTAGSEKNKMATKILTISFTVPKMRGLCVGGDMVILFSLDPAVFTQTPKNITGHRWYNELRLVS